MKNVKLLARIAALMLATVTVLSFVSCGKLFDLLRGGDDTEETGSTVDTNGDVKDTEGSSDSDVTESDDVTDSEEDEDADYFELEDAELNYKGVEFIVMMRNSDEHKSDFAVGFEGISAGMTALDMAVYKRNVAVQNLLGIKFVFVPAAMSGDERLDTVLSNNVSSGMEFYHLVANHGQYTFSHIQNQRAVDWTSLEYVNLENSWWNQSARTAWATPGGKVFAMNGDLSLMSVGNMSGIYYNKTIFENAQVTSPVEYVKNGTWTLENFKTVVKKVDASMVGDGSGTIETDTFAFAAQRYRYGVVIKSTGVEHLALGENGMYTVGIANNSRVVDAFESYNELFDTGLAFYDSRDIGVKGGIRERFKQESVAMTIDNLKCARDFAGNGTNFGIVPIFKYDDAVDGYPSTIGSGTNTFMIPITVKKDNREMVGAVVEAMAYYGQINVIPAYYEQILLYQTTQDLNDRDMIELIHDTAVVDLASYGNFGKITEIEWRTMEGEYSSLSNAIEATQNKAITELGEYWYTLDYWWDSLN